MKQKTYYTNQPPEFERGKLCSTLRLDIQQEPAVAAADETEAGPQWSAYEFTLYEPITQNNFVEQAFTELYGNDFEAKLINEYNAAKLGVYTGAEAQEMAERYNSFLWERRSLKSNIERICKEHGIE